MFLTSNKTTEEINKMSRAFFERAANEGMLFILEQAYYQGCRDGKQALLDAALASIAKGAKNE